MRGVCLLSVHLRLPCRSSHQKWPVLCPTSALTGILEWNGDEIMSSPCLDFFIYLLVFIFMVNVFFLFNLIFYAQFYISRNRSNKIALYCRVL